MPDTILFKMSYSSQEEIKSDSLRSSIFFFINLKDKRECNQIQGNI